MAVIARWAWVLALSKDRARCRPKKRFIVLKRCSTGPLQGHPIQVHQACGHFRGHIGA